MKESLVINAFDGLELSGNIWHKSTDVSQRGVVVLVHGMAETIERYDDFASFLSDNGYTVLGINQRGHGQRAEMQGYLGDNGWYKMKEDLRKVVVFAKSIVPDCPTFIIAHSMGSFVARDFLIDYSNLISGIILSGTGYPNIFSVKFGKWLAKLDMKKHGAKHINLILDRMVFGGYNKRIPAHETRYDWLSRDKAKVASYIADDFCGNVHPSSFFYEFSIAIERILETRVLNNVNIELAMLLISGDDDPVGEYGKGVVKVEKFYKEIGFRVSSILYPEGRHEMLNEINRHEVYEDILNGLSRMTANFL